METVAYTLDASILAFIDACLTREHPEGYLMAAAALGVAAEDCVVFEDAPAGIRAGLASGAKVLVVDGNSPLDPARLGSDSHLEGNIVGQVPNLDSMRIARADKPGLFQITW